MQRLRQVISTYARCPRCPPVTALDWPMCMHIAPISPRSCGRYACAARAHPHPALTTQATHQARETAAHLRCLAQGHSRQPARAARGARAESTGSLKIEPLRPEHCEAKTDARRSMPGGPASRATRVVCGCERTRARRACEAAKAAAMPDMSSTCLARAPCKPTVGHKVRAPPRSPWPGSPTPVDIMRASRLPSRAIRSLERHDDKHHAHAGTKGEHLLGRLLEG